MGDVGFAFSQFSIKYFSYLAYVYLFIFMHTIYVVNFKKNLDNKDIIISVSVLFLLFFVALILQALIVENPYNRGEIGNILIDSLAPVIGNIGLYLFVIFGFVISFLILVV